MQRLSLFLFLLRGLQGNILILFLHNQLIYYLLCRNQTVTQRLEIIFVEIIRLGLCANPILGHFLTITDR